MVRLFSAEGCMPVVGIQPVPPPEEFMYKSDFEEGENPDGTPIINIGFAKNGAKGVVDHALVADTAATVRWEDIIGKPQTFIPSLHGPQHCSDGNDPIANANLSAAGLVPTSTGESLDYLGGDLGWHPVQIPTYVQRELSVHLDPAWTAGAVIAQDSVPAPLSGVYAVSQCYMYAANQDWPPSADAHFELYDIDESGWVPVTQVADVSQLDSSIALLRPVLLWQGMVRVFRAPPNGLQWRLVLDVPGGAESWFRIGIIFERTLVTPPPFMPEPPSAPPDVVTNCPNLVFASDFGQPDFTDRLADYGPLVGPYKWAVNRADDFGMGFQLRPAIDTHTYNTDIGGYLTLKLRWWGPIDGWATGAINSAAYLQGGAIAGQPTGFLASVPSYWEAAIWLPQSFAAGVPGVWPFIRLYTDPSSSAPWVEYTLAEFHSADYTQMRCGWHLWDIDGTQIAAGDNSPTSGMLPDMSLEWHILGIWIDTATVRWYLDGLQVYSAPTPLHGTRPVYVQIANGYDTPFGLDQDDEYTMKVAYIHCWTA